MILSDRADPEAAAANRASIEATIAAGLPVVLPRGEISIDRAIAIAGAARIFGGGAGVTRLANLGAPGQAWGASACLNVNGSGLAYADAFVRIDATTISTAAAPYLAGMPLWLWKWSSYDSTGCVRRRVVKCSGKIVSLDGPVPDGLNSAKTFGVGGSIEDAAEGDGTVTLLTADAGKIAVGASVLITSGPTYANEAPGCRRIVLAVEGLRITVDKPLRRSYRAAGIIALRPAGPVTIRDLTLGRTPGVAVLPSIWASVTRGLRVEDCHLEANLDFTASEFVTAQNTTCAGSFVVNSSTDSGASGGRFAGISLEEACSDISFADLLVTGGSAPNGIMATTGVERLSARNVRISGATASGFIAGGREFTLRDIDCRGNGAPSYVAGDGLRVSGLRGDGWRVTGGRGISLSHCTGIAGAEKGATGTAVDCPGFSPDKPGGWNIWP